ncbi:HoxN/HupN/NixA family nickel/cobalt transporter [Effusibacillus pohliae]|uniref:HoxN/HupN/NixA family nickel/cobalt transporter n=1 Tax=Effusibacillus pohliae TaxID=232270 RepID=UPI000369AC18|nr:sulfite exporter TauE/SafE family protein [Effusibacillus pohliae]
MDLLYTIPAAIGLGALHSLEPGHGKGVMTAYLISSRAKAKDAVLLGVISAIAHTLSIILLAFAASSTVKMLVPANLSHWIELVSGAIITMLGARILYSRFYPKIVVVGTIGRAHADTCDHHHHGSHLHSHGAPTSLSRLFAIGFFTGLIPCPSALAIFLAAVAADRIPAGMSLVAAFSAGSALAMSTLGLLVVRAGGAIQRLEQRQVVQTLASVSSILILALGLYVAYRAFQHLALL